MLDEIERKIDEESREIGYEQIREDMTGCASKVERQNKEERR